MWLVKSENGSVERLNTLNNDFQSILQNIINLKLVKQSLFSLMPEVAVHMNLPSIWQDFLEHLFRVTYDNHIQNRCSKKSSKIHRKTPVLESPYLQASDMKLC